MMSETTSLLDVRDVRERPDLADAAIGLEKGEEVRSCKATMHWTFIKSRPFASFAWLSESGCTLRSVSVFPILCLPLAPNPSS